MTAIILNLIITFCLVDQELLDINFCTEQIKECVVDQIPFPNEMAWQSGSQSQERQALEYCKMQGYYYILRDNGFIDE